MDFSQRDHTARNNTDGASHSDAANLSIPIDPDYATAWMADGKCRSYPPAVFFPSDGVGVDRARKICKDCPVAETCLEYALEQRIEHGVWGGCSERERRRILKRRKSPV